MSYPWEEIDVPAGSYIGWGNWPGQYALGVVISYSDTAGSTQKGEPCPETTLELLEPAASFDKQGNRTDYPAGAIVQITHSQVSSNKAARAAGAVPGDLVKYTLTEYLVGQGKEGGDVKVFGVNIVRGYRPVAPKQQSGFAPPPQNGAPPNFGAAQGPQQFTAPAQQFGGPPQSASPTQHPPFAPQQYAPPPQQGPPAFGTPGYPLPPEPPQFGGQPVTTAAPSFGGADEPPPF